MEACEWSCDGDGDGRVVSSEVFDNGELYGLVSLRRRLAIFGTELEVLPGVQFGLVFAHDLAKTLSNTNSACTPTAYGLPPLQY